jgi:biopolymer transport protein ExbD
VGEGKSKLGVATPEMNVTPLVDVVLVLLIIFMVITPMLSKQFWVHLPEDRKENVPPPPPNDGPVVVTVAKDGTIRVNRDEVALARSPPRASAPRSSTPPTTRRSGARRKCSTTCAAAARRRSPS